MNLKRLHLRGFTRYLDATVSFPRRGLIVLTGDNGAGKSSLVEAQAMGLWGKTLRGTKPWSVPAVPQAFVEVETYEGLTANRNTAAFKWQTPDSNTKFETTTKANDALARVIGDFDVWRRTSVFSSSDASHFTLATDGERKRLLEQVLGVGVFDTALEDVRTDLKRAVTTVATARQEEAVLNERVQGARAQLEQAREALAREAPVLTEAEVEAFERRYQTAKDAYTRSVKATEAARAQARVLVHAVGYADAEVRLAESTAARFRVDTCPTCTQPIAPTVRLHAHTLLVAAREKAEAVRVETNVRVAEAEALVRELDEETAAFSVKFAKLRTTRDELTRDAARRAIVERSTANAGTSLAAAEAALAEASAARVTADRSRAELTAVEVALGFRGVRTQIVARALSGLESVANAYLGRIAGTGIELKLRPYSEQKSGKVADSLSLEILGGPGGGYGYRAASNGERRRVDVALLLALGEMTAAANGAEPGTLWVDEAMDGLDADGVAGAAEVLRELAGDRCVIVVTHVPAVAAALRPDVTWRATGGRIEAL